MDLRDKVSGEVHLEYYIIFYVSIFFIFKEGLCYFSLGWGNMARNIKYKLDKSF